MAAAGDVFAADGYADGSVREIAERAKVNVASINYYFGSKEALYREVLLAVHQRLLEQEAPPPLAEEPTVALREWVHFCLRFVLLKRSTHPQLGKIMMHEMRQPTAALADLVKLVIKPLFSNLVGIVTTLMPPETSKKHRELAAHQIVGMCIHFDHNREVIGLLGFTTPESEAGIRQLADSIASMALAGLQSPSK